VFLRQLEYLTALARERHFGRAAQACHVSQPALSAAIRKLERELGVALVNRQQRYDDLTPEGRALLPWAQQALASLDGLTAEAARLRHSLTGTLRLGVIPTALNAASLITGPLLERHPASASRSERSPRSKSDDGSPTTTSTPASPTSTTNRSARSSPRRSMRSATSS